MNLFIKMKFIKVVVLLFFLPNVFSENLQFNSKEVFDSLSRILDFSEEFYNELNFDAVLGIVIAKSQLELVLKEENCSLNQINNLVSKCDWIISKTYDLLPNYPKRMVLFKKFLMDSTKWIHISRPFIRNQLQDLGMYNWTVQQILNNKKASYKRLSTDICLEEAILYNNGNKKCYSSSVCKEIMLERRIDTGYLLSHRLLYLNVLEMTNCQENKGLERNYKNQFCSLMLKEAKTNSRLSFPYHDIFLEQTLFCGTKGYIEFLKKEWLEALLSWQEPFGCFKSVSSQFSKRNSNEIAFGCRDHPTGLAAGVLALYLRYFCSL